MSSSESCPNRLPKRLPNRLPKSRSTSTRALAALQAAGVDFASATYDYNPAADKIGLQAAAALGEPPSRVLKTLMLDVDGAAACVVVPCDAEVAMKQAAAAFAAKAARMMRPADAERLTGYKVGGISPFGQKRRVPTAIEIRAMAEEHVFVNGGRRGLQVRIAPADAVAALGAIVAPLVAP